MSAAVDFDRMKMGSLQCHGRHSVSFCVMCRATIDKLFRQGMQAKMGMSKKNQCFNEEKSSACNKIQNLHAKITEGKNRFSDIQ